VTRFAALLTALPLFFVSKSENRNQVYYSVRMDAECRPLGANPVYAYWRMYEQGPGVTEGLLEREQPYYGLGPQYVSPTLVETTLRALPKRPIRIQLRRAQTGCIAEPLTVINGRWAHLQSVHVLLAWPFGVSELRIHGWEGSKPVQEAVKP
jgi:hypothetical protein